MVLLWLLCAGAAHAAQIVVVNSDNPGVGFNDSRPALPAAGSNGGTTLGQQRLRVIQRAAEIWAAVLDSPVPIRVQVRMTALTCSDASVTLGTGGPSTLAWNFPNAPRPETAYPIALANALARSDLSSGDDLVLNFNLQLDQGCSGSYAGWWYGLGADEPAPADRFSMLAVALHEFAHGLGFLGTVDSATGSWVSSRPGLWGNYLYDQQRGLHWRSMSNGERATSARNDPYLVWTGRHVNEQKGAYLRGVPELVLTGVRGGPLLIPGLTEAEFGGSVDDLAGPGEIRAVNDGVAAAGDVPGTVTDGCEFPFANGERLAGRTALVDRGGCTFVQKARNAQQHGAHALLVANNIDGAVPPLGGADADVTIPVFGVLRITGEQLRRLLPRSILQASFAETDTLRGTQFGCMRMHAPTAVATGSSVSHFTSDAHPSLLMEPGLGRTLFDQLDLTVDLLRDIGWPMLLAPPPPAASDCATLPLP
jgi:hypothetical protein